jgi:LemA protein
MFLLILGLLILLPVVYVIVTYNSLVRLSQMIKESWANVDTELRRRYDLIPNLVETVKGYTQHEREVLERIAQIRSDALTNHEDPETQAQKGNALVKELKTLFAVVEGYPELKANQNYLRLQEELINTEDRIQAARRFYNGNIRDLNNKVLTFPSSLIASLAGYSTQNYFEIESLEIRKPVTVNFQQ